MKRSTASLRHGDGGRDVRGILLATLVLLPALAGCATDEPVREVPYSELLAAATAGREDPQADDRLVAAGGVEAGGDPLRGNGLAPAWTYIFASSATSRLECVVVGADGTVRENRAYPIPANSTLGATLDGAIDSPAAVAGARKDTAFGTEAVKAQRWVETLTSGPEGAYWIVATVTAAGKATGVEVDAATGGLRRPFHDLEATSPTARCP